MPKKIVVVCKTCDLPFNQSQWSVDECMPCRYGLPRCQFVTQQGIRCGKIVHNIRDSSYCWQHRHEQEVPVSSRPDWLKELVDSRDRGRVQPPNSQNEDRDR